MDWIDPRQAKKLRQSERRDTKSPLGEVRRKPLVSQLRAALAQPLDVWSTAYGYALDRLKWPRGCSAERTFQWSCCSDEQVAILLRCGTCDHQRPEIGAEVDVEVSSSAQARAPSAMASGWMDLPIEDCATDWLDGLANDAECAFGVAALTWQLPRHATALSGSWSSEWLREVGNKLARLTVSDEDAAICHVVCQCELPLLLGTVTGASRSAVFAGAEEAMDNLALLLEQSEDQPAIWLAYGASYLRASLASVLRCRVLANDLGLRKWYPPQNQALAELLNHAARWIRPDGSQMLGAIGTGMPNASVWDSLVKLARRPSALLDSMGMARSEQKKSHRNRLKRKIEKSQLPDLSIHVEEARGACLLSDWCKLGGRVAVDYSDSTVRLEVLGPKGRTLLMGDWTADVRLEGESLLQMDDWEKVCWFSDDDVDYLEIEARFGDKSRVQRQIVLLREDRLLLLADALLCDQAGNWSLSTSIPVASSVDIQTAERSNEVFLKLSDSQRALVMPLAMPEWRRELSPLELNCRHGHLSLVAKSPRMRQYAPLLVSLAGYHSKKPFTWRRLTVAEDLGAVASDVAAAYRAQIGLEQWLLYRTLAKPARRTAMGMHTGAEFVAARFCGEGAEYETLVEVETGED